MDALKNLVSNVPDWLHKLDELNGQIEQRQNELARVAEKDKERSPDGRSSGAPKSIRNKGSTESLRPRDEPEAHPRESTPQPQLETRKDNGDAAADAAAAGAAAAKAGAGQPPSSPSDSHSPSAIQRQENKVRAAGQARARATLRKRQRTDSVMSGDGGPPKYRTRSMIIVYYDSYVQIFFEELVKFVSASRNMMRKAKMAAKVAQIKRLAELDMPDDDEDDEKKEGDLTAASGDGTIEAAPASPNGNAEEVPALQYVSTRRLMGGGPSAMMAARAAMGRSYGRAGARNSVTLGPDGKSLQGDVYDELDKGLEFVQSMCEHAAHQFLRDGDCGEEVSKIQRRLRETKELADKEMERVKKESPACLQKDAEEIRGRSYRPQSMRKDNLNALKAAETNGLGSEMKLEVDDGAEDVEVVLPPRLMYRSTRAMKSQ
ncbi:hypothetical protein QBC40DRAFT_37890 [Triangularia verruculosa]|uniref:Uncharacterized protein n=1 Tax=Triangularia verruculosa TaxID=2587418 RepID=A0AAN6XQS1_9PEZI|nr:hypothetical protein QBC40DRAFT_37890 [Triangularia verruculosa]